jgi:hypothetical protein
VSNGRMLKELLIRKDLEGSGHSSFKGIILDLLG